MGKIVLSVLFLCLAGLGMSVIYWSNNLSLRYNAWTTGLRERHPRINPPPTPRMRTLNTKIMTWLFRFVGAYIILASMFLLSIVWKAN